MTNEEIRASLASAFADSWATATDIAWPDKNFSPDPDQDWTKFELVFGKSFVGELGRSINCLGERVGILLISIYVPPNSGLKISLNYADRVEAIFRRQCINGVEFDEPSSNPIGIESILSGQSGTSSNFHKTLVQSDFFTWIGE